MTPNLKLICGTMIGCASVVVTFGRLWCHSHDIKLGINSFIQCWLNVDWTLFLQFSYNTISTLSNYTDNDPIDLNMRLRLSIFRIANLPDYPQFECGIPAIQQGLNHSIGNLYLVTDQWSLFRQSAQFRLPAALHSKLRSNAAPYNEMLH